MVVRASTLGRLLAPCSDGEGELAGTVAVVGRAHDAELVVGRDVRAVLVHGAVSLVCGDCEGSVSKE